LRKEKLRHLRSFSLRKSAQGHYARRDALRFLVAFFFLAAFFFFAMVFYFLFVAASIDLTQNVCLIQILCAQHSMRY